MSQQTGELLGIPLPGTILTCLCECPQSLLQDLVLESLLFQKPLQFFHLMLEQIDFRHGHYRAIGTHRPQCGTGTTSIVRAATRLDPNQTRQQLREELQHLRARQRLAPLDYSVLIHTMRMKNLLRNVQPATSKLHRDSPSL
jgi:hypothetical protein